MVLSCVMLLPIIDKWNMSWFAHFVIHLPVNLLQFSAAASFVMTCRHSSAITCFAVQFPFCGDLVEVLYMRVMLTCLWKNFMNIVLICSCTNVVCYDILQNAVTACMYSSQVWLHYHSLFVNRVWYHWMSSVYMKKGLLFHGVPCRSASRLRMLHAMRGCCLHRCSPAASW